MTTFARCCGAKHISKSKCAKHTNVGALLEVGLSKKCAPLWREAYFQVKMYKHTSLGARFEVEMSKKCMPLWREAPFQVKMLKTPHARTAFEGSDVVLRCRCKGFCTLPKMGNVTVL